jgi:integrase
MATIRKRGLRWQAQVRRQGHAPVSRTFTLKGDAQAWARSREAELDRNADVAIIDRQLMVMTLGQVLERYRAEVTPSKRGAASENTRLGVMMRHAMAATPLHRLQASVIASYRSDRLLAVAEPSVRRELVILHHCLEVARRDWGLPIPKNPASQIVKPAAGRPRDRRPTTTELAELEIAVHRCRNPVIHDVFLFAIETGMRRGEILSLVWPDVDVNRRTARLPLTKNGEARMVPLSPAAIAVLKAAREHEQQHGATDRTIRGLSASVFPISANAFRLAWERAKRHAGIENLRFHDLRHESISRFFERGLSVAEVALISGHKDVRMLFRYTHLRAEDVAAKLARPQV